MHTPCVSHVYKFFYILNLNSTAWKMYVVASLVESCAVHISHISYQTSQPASGATHHLSVTYTAGPARKPK